MHFFIFVYPLVTAAARSPTLVRSSPTLIDSPRSTLSRIASVRAGRGDFGTLTLVVFAVAIAGLLGIADASSAGVGVPVALAFDELRR